MSTRTIATRYGALRVSGAIEDDAEAAAIERWLYEAGEAGDSLMSADCASALDGDELALRRVRRAIKASYVSGGRLASSKGRFHD